MNQKIISSLVVAAGALLLSATNGFSYSDYGTDVNNACSPVAPFTGSCTLCHTSSKSASTPAKTAFLAGGDTLTNFFCPPPAVPTCTDNDNDGYSVEGGNCGPVDCDDSNAAIKPGAAENCSDNIDNNCNGLVDAQDPAAVGCLVCTDKDADGFSIEGGQCGPVDCNDNVAAINPNATDIANNGIDENCSGADSVDPTTLDKDGDGYTQASGDCNDANPAVHPGAIDIPNNGIDENCDGADSIDTSAMDNDGDGFTPAQGDCDDTNSAVHPNAIEECSDQIDNDCNGLIDIQDLNAVDCPVTCTDSDGDTYATNGGDCGPVDCNDLSSVVNPSAKEICGDGIDNNCDGSIDEGCDVTCPDADGDGYMDAACGGNDCNDSDATINPGTAEVCGNAIDENCNGSSDDTCLTCPDGSLLLIESLRYNRDHKQLIVLGKATVGTTISIINADTNETLIDGIKVNHRSTLWRAALQGVSKDLKNITVISSNNCALDASVSQSVSEREERRYGKKQRSEREDSRDGSKRSSEHRRSFDSNRNHPFDD